MMDMTFCTDRECPAALFCKRFSIKEDIAWRFTETPRNGDYCDMFWGENQQSIMDMLERVVKGEER